MVLGFDHLVTGYEGESDCFFGSTMGRNANRIGGAAFEIDGVTYHLAANENGNNLHTDFDHGFHKAIWNAELLEDRENAVDIFLSIVPMAKMVFLGNLEDICYLHTARMITVYPHRVMTVVSDKKTIINVTNHSYFNLAGHDSRQYL